MRRDGIQISFFFTEFEGNIFFYEDIGTYFCKSYNDYNTDIFLCCLNNSNIRK